MSVILILIPVSLVFATAFLGAFFWAVRSGQFEDTCTPSLRLLADDGTAPVRPAEPGVGRPSAPASASAPVPGALPGATPFNHED